MSDALTMRPYLWFALLFVTTAGCAHIRWLGDKSDQAAILFRETLRCQAAGHPADDDLRCEPSGVVFSQDTVWLVNDKTIGTAPTSSIMRSAFQGYRLSSTAVGVRGNPISTSSKKWEDIDKTPDGKYIVATTGFDRIKDDGSWDVYSRLVSWPTGNFEQLSLVQPSSERHGVQSHIDLRNTISEVLMESGFANSEYFKIEGLTLTDKHILLGIREVGLSYEAFQYTVTIVGIPYSVNVGILQLSGKPFILKTLKLEDQSWGLSSLTLGHHPDMLLVMVSQEAGPKITDLNARLLRTNLRRDDASYSWITDATGSPLEFYRKGEGIAHLGSQRYVIIHDDDRRIGTGRDNTSRSDIGSASYDIIQFTE